MYLKGRTIGSKALRYSRVIYCSIRCLGSGIYGACRSKESRAAFEVIGSKDPLNGLLSGGWRYAFTVWQSTGHPSKSDTYDGFTLVPCEPRLNDLVSG